jgi:hypothetical protein
MVEISTETWALMVALLVRAAPHCPEALKTEIRALLKKGFST